MRIDLTHFQGHDSTTIANAISEQFPAVSPIAVGDYVTWKEPTTETEGNERYIVTEVNGDRCFIKFVCDLPFPPVTLARTADLVDVYASWRNL